MKFAPLTHPILLALCLLLASCTKADAPAAAQAYDAVASKGTGFTVGPMLSNSTVYVLFDPQCPHCGHLWQASQSLVGTVRFVWVPVAFINGESAAQGAALLSASKPAELMAAHEAALLAGTGGVPAPASAPIDAEQAIAHNTQLFNSLGLESVPFIVAKNARTGQVVTHNGALATAELAVFLGIPPAP